MASKNTTSKTQKTKTSSSEKKTGKFGLGKGMSSLIPLNPTLEKETKEDNTIKTGETLININLIEPNPEQPRKKFDEDALGELAESIKIHGLIQPIIVQKKNEIYQIVAGERRWRACRLAKLKEVPVIIKDLTKNEQYEIALIENIQREDLNDIEEANAYKSLIEEFNLTHDELAERVSKSRVAITNSLRLLNLNKNVQSLVIDGLISGGHARALLALKDEKLQQEIATKIIDEKLSVRETEKLVRQLVNKSDKNTKRKTFEEDAVYKDFEEKLRSLLGTKVEIKQNGHNKGKIVIDYNSTDEFEKIFDIIKR